MNHKFDCLVITGGIGSGKSSVLKLFKEVGYHIINADDIAHKLLYKESPYYNEYAEKLDLWLGTNYREQDGIDRTELRNLLNKTLNGFEIISKIVEPFIINAMNDDYQTAIEKNKKVVFEVPLLIEANLTYLFKDVLVITCDINKRKERVKKRDSFLTDKDIEHRIALQSSDEEKIKVATYVIDNSGSDDDLKNNFMFFYKAYLKKHKKLNY